MPVTVERHPNLLVFRFSGEVSVDDVWQVGDWCDEDDRTTGGLTRFADATAITGARIHFGDVVRLTGERRQLRRPGVVRTAILVNSHLAYGIARMYATLLDHPQVHIEVFRDRKAAFAFLSAEDPDAAHR